MPASYVHICVASSAALKMAREGEHININAVLAGAEGPDPLFYSFRTKKGKLSLPETASIMHKARTGRFLDALAKNAADSPLLRSYTYGFLAHYATDTVCHPYIYTRSFDEDGTYNGNKHCKFEHSLDTYVFRRNGFMKGLPKQMEGFALLDRREKAEIAEFLAKTISEVYPENAPDKAAIGKSFSDAVFYCKLLRRESQKKSSILLKLAMKTKLSGLIASHTCPDVPVCDFDGSFSASGFTWENMLNRNHSEWRSYWEPDRTRTESFDELYCRAVTRAAELMNCAGDLFAGEKSPAEFSALHGDYSYDSGIDWEKTRRL